VDEQRDDLEALEMRLLLEAVHERYGLDFRDYAPGSLRRRLWKRINEEGLRTVSGLLERVLHDSACMERLLLDLSVNVTAMFRDPPYWQALQKHVFERLHTYAFTRIWVAGCSTGEEVWSLAIALHEHGLLERTRIYATDMNEKVLEVARMGVFPMERMQEYTRNYLAAGGDRSFSEYYTAGYDGAIFQRSLADNVVFAHHNLATDRSFNEFHVVICRNVLIYFDKPLQNRVHELFWASLPPLGMLALGPKESVQFSPHADQYENLDELQRIYRRAQ